MFKGYISLHRKLLEWEWYQDNNVKSVFLHCLIKANFQDKNWCGQTIKRGQFITSILNLSAELNLSPSQIRLCISKLIKTNEIIVNTTNKNTLITVVKYDDYQLQDNEHSKQKANKKQTKDKQTTTTNNDNNINNENNIYRAFNHLKLSNADFKKLNQDYSKAKIDDCLDKIENYKGNKNYKSLYLTAKNWLKKETSKKQITKIAL